MADGEILPSAPELDEDKRKIKKEKRKKKHHKYKHHQREEFIPNYDISGVVHIVLTDEVQKVLQCVVGDVITAEKPWRKILKENILEQIEGDDGLEEFSCFVPYKQQIIDYPSEKMLLGYIPDESREYDEFYFCLNTEAEEEVNAIIKKIETIQQTRLNNAICKIVYPWKTCGSGEEVDENIMRYSRGLYRIEFETKYPIMHGHVQFKKRLVQDVRDGYLELLVSNRNAVTNVYKKRIDAEIQVAPSVQSKEAQTNCAYPKNAWTQYAYECEYVTKVTKDFLTNFADFIGHEFDNLSDHLNINGNINLFTNDYLNLVMNEKYAKEQAPIKQHEYMSFKDINQCKDKMISAVAWHPMWTGVVALAYANNSPLWYQTQSNYIDMAEIVHGYNPILIWSFNDGLNAKLCLETNQEVHCLSFCPHDENVLVGGCAGGQVVIWDIRNKMLEVETDEILTTAQQNYRIQMFAYMNWMKNTRNISIIPPTATSEIQFSHQNNVTSTHWIHPKYRLTKTGQYEEMEDGETSLQFITSSADSTIKFWDLKQKPISMPGDYKPQRKSRRLKKRPSALTLHESPFRILHRRMKPHYQLNVIFPKIQQMCPVTSALLPRFDLKYEHTDSNKYYALSERQYYNYIHEKLEDIPAQEFVGGSYFGDFFIGSWEGFEYMSGEIYAQEQAKIINIAKYHDGPVLTITRHPYRDDIFLTVGGKVFAIWKSSLKKFPLFWRRSRHKYTSGHWCNTKPTGFRLNRSDGNREIWDFAYRSDRFYYDVAYSGKTLLDAKPHELPLPSGIIGVSDDKGSFRLIYATLDVCEKQDFKLINDIFDSTAIRKTEFYEWQTNWTEINEQLIRQQNEEAVAEQQRKKEEMEMKRQLEEQLRELQEAEAAKRAAAKLRPPPGKFEEWAHEQWIVKEQERMGNVLLSKKRLDRETLIRQQAPLKKMEMLEERKRHKQKERLHKANEIFLETITMLFPDILESKTTIETEVISSEETNSLKIKYFDTYANIEAETDTFIEENPYVYKFDWKDILQSTKTKDKNAAFENIPSHRQRYQLEKMENIPYTSVVSKMSMRSNRKSTSTNSIPPLSKSSVDENIA